MNKKYEFTNEHKIIDGHILHRIRALRDFGDVIAGYLGGWIEKEENLSRDGTCWVYREARVYEDSRVYGDGRVFGQANVYGSAVIFENARVCGEARVFGKAQVRGEAIVFGKARVCGDAIVCGVAKVHGKALVYGRTLVRGNASIYSGSIASTDDYMVVGPIGSRNDFTTFFKDGDKIMVKCGCFRGDIEEFEDAVEERHIYTKHYAPYLQAIKLATVQLWDPESGFVYPQMQKPIAN